MRYIVDYDVYTPWRAEVEADSLDEARDKFNRGETSWDSERGEGTDHIIQIKEVAK